MPDTPISQDQLYDPILAHVRPAPLILKPDDDPRRRTRESPRASVHANHPVLLRRRREESSRWRRADSAPADESRRVSDRRHHDYGCRRDPVMGHCARGGGVLRQSPVPRVPRGRGRRDTRRRRRRDVLYRGSAGAGEAVVRRHLSDHRHPRDARADAVEQLQGSVPVAALQCRRRAALRLHPQPLRRDAGYRRRAGAVHSGGARARREREHSVGHADAAEPPERQGPVAGALSQRRERGRHGAHARASPAAP